MPSPIMAAIALTPSNLSEQLESYLRSAMQIGIDNELELLQGLIVKPLDVVAHRDSWFFAHLLRLMTDDIFNHAHILPNPSRGVIEMIGMIMRYRYHISFFSVWQHPPYLG